MYTTQGYWPSPQPRAREKHPQGLTSDARSNEARCRPSASIHSDQKQGRNELPRMIPQQTVSKTASTELSLRQKIESLKRSLTQTTANETSLKLENDKQKRRLAWAAFTEKWFHREIETLKLSLTQTTANETSLKRENDKQQKGLAWAASTEKGLHREIETLKESLTRSTTNEESLKQESENLRSLLVQVASAGLTLRREMDELQAFHARTVSADPKLKEEIEVLKATLTHALTSERDMRTSARETREEWEKVEKSLREEINALRTGPETIWNGVDVKGETVALHVEQTIQGKVLPIALTQPIKPPEGSSGIHVLLDDLALQSLVTDDLNPTPPARSDAFGSSFLPEFTALERATEGLQQAVNSELRAAYAKKWATSSPGSVPQSKTSAARNLRLLVVLWEASGVEELLRSLTSIVGDATPTMGSEDCAICTEEIPPEHRIVVEGCKHATCKECLRKYIGAKLGEKVWPVRCPICTAGGRHERRAQAITRPLLDELVLPTTVLSQWTDFELSQFIIPVTCPKCEKSNLFELTEYNRSKILICNHGCECAWCRDCSRKVDISVPHNCEDEALEELAGERRWMRCPRPSCRVMVEKNMGCNHIACRCGMHFCYLCGEDITGRVTQHACRQQS